MKRVTITFDDDLMNQLDPLIHSHGYQNRSEAIRDLTRAGLKHTSMDAGNASDCVGVLSYVYDHVSRELAKRLTNMFHDHHHLTVSSPHVHLDPANCLEVSVLNGKTADVQNLAERVIVKRSVRHGKLAVIPVDEAMPVPHDHIPEQAHD